MRDESHRSDFMGKNGFVWWQGVVEDIYDPLKLGRVRVRVLGWHTDDKTEIPTKDLPWAHVIMPVNSASVSGKGWSPTGLVQGAWVVGFFRDGSNSQEPVVFGTLGGINIVNLKLPKLSSEAKSNPTLQDRARQEIEAKKQAVVNAIDATKNDAGLKPYELPRNPLVDTNRGYNDPEGLYPLISRMGEADTNRLARNEQVQNTIVQFKKKNLVECSTALCGMWKEPETPYNAKYPFNNVYESQAGHIVEYDDTPGNERMHWYHCSGSFTEIHPSGSEVHKVVKNSWDITMNDKMILVKGNASFNADKILKIRIGKDLEIEVEGDAKMLVKGNMTSEVKGNYLHKVGGSCTIASNSNMVLVAPRIDFNPEGEDASSIKTFLEDARSLVNNLMQTFVAPNIPSSGLSSILSQAASTVAPSTNFNASNLAQVAALGLGATPVGLAATVGANVAAQQLQP